MKTSLLLCVCVLIAAPLQSQNLLQNGSFETPVIPEGQQEMIIPGWTGGGYLVRGTSGLYPPPPQFPDGSQVLGVVSDGETISQTFSLGAPSALRLQYFDAHEMGSGSSVQSWATITALGSGTMLTSPTFSANLNPDTWKQNTWNIGTLAPGNYEFTLRMGGEAVYDNVQLTVVPEPSVWALAISGLAIIALRKRRNH